MKRLFVLVLVGIMSMSAFCQEPEHATLPFNWLDMILDNWASISGIAFYVIYRLIPTGKADRIKAVVDWLWNLIPDRKAGGGTH